MAISTAERDALRDISAQLGVMYSNLLWANGLGFRDGNPTTWARENLPKAEQQASENLSEDIEKFASLIDQKLAADDYRVGEREFSDGRRPAKMTSFQGIRDYFMVFFQRFRAWEAMVRNACFRVAKESAVADGRPVDVRTAEDRFVCYNRRLDPTFNAYSRTYGPLYIHRFNTSFTSGALRGGGAVLLTVFAFMLINKKPGD